MCMFYSIDTLLSCVDDGPEGSECSMETPGDHQDKYNTENEKDSNTLGKNYSGYCIKYYKHFESRG